MTCKQLGGACDHAFHAETFEDMAAQTSNMAKRCGSKVMPII